MLDWYVGYYYVVVVVVVLVSPKEIKASATWLPVEIEPERVFESRRGLKKARRMWRK